MQSAHQWSDFRSASLGHDIEHVIQRSFGGLRRDGLNVVERQGRAVFVFVQREFFHHAGKIAGANIVGDVDQCGHAVPGHIANLRFAQNTFDFAARGWVVIDAGGIGIAVPFEGFSQFGCRLELAGRHDNLRVSRLPGFKSRDDRWRRGVVGVLDKDRPDTWEKSNGLDRIHQLGRILAQIRGGHPGQAHFLFGCWAKQGRKHLLTLERYAHRIGPINQDTGLARIRAGKIALGLARAQLHSPACSVDWRPSARLTVVSSSIVI